MVESGLARWAAMRSTHRPGPPKAFQQDDSRLIAMEISIFSRKIRLLIAVIFYSANEQSQRRPIGGGGASKAYAEAVDWFRPTGDLWFRLSVVRWLRR